MSLPIQLGATSGSPSGYNIQRSLRFRSSASAYLNRTPASASNRQVCTWSGWVKKGSLTTLQGIFGSYNGSDRGTFLIFNDTGEIQFYGFTVSGYDVRLITTAVYRDPSAWYHIVLSIDTTQATSTNRIKLYVNGVQVTSFSTATYPTQNYSTYYNQNQAHTIGAESSSNRYFDGYLAEVNFIDGQALTPSSFGQTDAVTGVWTPKKYTGTYGTNGFYLPFSDNTSATTLAYDKSGNGNNWTPNNISTTAGATYDSMTDVPTLTSATAANFATLNPIGYGYQFSSSYASSPTNAVGATLSQGNLYARGANAGTGYYGSWVGTIPLDNGKWYWEATLTAEPTADFSFPGIVRYDNGTTNAPYLASNGSYTLNDVLGFTWDDTAKELKWYKNGTLQTTIVTGATGSYLPFVGLANANEMAFNFGQRPFSYTPPTGFKALNTFNLPDPTIKKPNQYMDATLYTGTSAIQSVTNSGSMQPDLVWIKARSVAYGHVLSDSVRGVSASSAPFLLTNATDAEYNANGTVANRTVTSLDANGFTLGADSYYLNFNASGKTYVGWQWKESATAGFDIVTYTGTGVAQNISHNLGVAPKMIIVKARSGTSDWSIYTATTGAGNYVLLNTTGASAASSTKWNNAAPTSSVFSVGIDTTTNMATVTYVAYLFAEIPGFSKFGSFVGTASADGPFVYLGFRPKFVMWKNASNATGFNWEIGDSTRSAYNLADVALAPNLSDAEVSGGSAIRVDFLSNGFKIRDSGNVTNGSGATIIYAAFAEFPTKYSLAR